VPKDKKARGNFENWVKAQGWPPPDYHYGQGCGTNARPDYQQLLAGPTAGDPFICLLIWLDSTEEGTVGDRLEHRVRKALTNPGTVARFGGLSLGESTHLVDEVDLLPGKFAEDYEGQSGRAFVATKRGRLTLPVWVDHVGSAGTRFVTGDLVSRPVLQQPSIEEMPQINPGELQ
jgi:CRISPR-associated protein Cas5t